MRNFRCACAEHTSGQDAIHVTYVTFGHVTSDPDPPQMRLELSPYTSSALYIRINIIHMATSVSRRLNILCIVFKIIALFLITLFARLYVRVSILLTCGKHLHDCIISLRREAWAHTTSLTSPLFIKVPVPSQES